jgi:hypothetical protein
VLHGSPDSFIEGKEKEAGKAAFSQRFCGRFAKVKNTF